MIAGGRGTFTLARSRAVREWIDAWERPLHRAAGVADVTAEGRPRSSGPLYPASSMRTSSPPRAASIRATDEASDCDRPTTKSSSTACVFSGGCGCRVPATLSSRREPSRRRFREVGRESSALMSAPSVTLAAGASTHGDRSSRASESGPLLLNAGHERLGKSATCCELIEIRVERRERLGDRGVHARDDAARSEELRGSRHA